MRNKRIGKRTMKMQNSPTIISTASIVGPKEGKGPLKDKFDVILSDDLYGEKTWELAESKMIQTALETAVQKVEKQLDDIEFLFGGDLNNTLILCTLYTVFLRLIKHFSFLSITFKAIQQSAICF